MAWPQRPDFHDISGGDASHPRGPRRGHPPAGRRVRFLITLLIAVVLAGAFFYWISFGWEGTGGYWWHRQAAPVQSSATARQITGTGLPVLDATDKRPYIGQPFQLSNVPIQRKMSNRIFWIGANSQSPMLVVLNGNQDPAQFKSLTKGSMVDIAGRVTKAPTAMDAATQWSLNEPEVAQLEKEGTYIQATQIYPSPG